MSQITFVLGRCGSDKSLRICEAVRQKAQSQSVFVIVPDQYTLTAEKLYMDQLGEKQMRFVQIVSIKRLIKLYEKKSENIGAGGRSALVWSAYSQVKEQLLFYKNSQDIFFISALCEQINNLKLYGITPDDLQEPATENEKLHDIALIYGAYNALLGQDRPDPSDRFYQFARQAGTEKIFNGTEVFVDFFKVLNAAELAVLQGIVSGGGNLTVGLFCRGTESLDHISPVTAVYKKLLRFAEKNEIPVNTIHANGFLSKYPEFQFLEKNLFADGEPYPNPTPNITFYRAADMRDELDYIAAKIRELVRDGGHRYADFALVTRDTTKYDAYIDAVFAEYDIPVFRHKKSTLRQKPPVRFLYALFCTVKNNFNQADVLDLVKTGYVPDVSEQDAALFESYVNIWDIRFSAFTKPFTRSVRGFTSVPDNAEDVEKLNRINAVRVAVIKLVDIFGKPSNTDTVRNFCTKVFQVFEKADIEAKLIQSADVYAKYGRYDLYEENLQIYALLLRALDEFVCVCADEFVTAARFFDQLFAVLDSYDIGILPTAIDTVLLGNADTVPLYAQKYVFVFGLTEGDFPASAAENGLIGEKERHLLGEYGLLLGREPYETYLYEQFIAYFALTSATDKLFLSYPAIGTGEKQPSSAFIYAKDTFPQNPVSDPPRLSNETAVIQRLQAARPAFELLRKLGVQPPDDLFKELKSNHLRAHNEKNRLTSETAERLYGKNLTVSATSSDRFFKCPYYYLYQNGLHLNIPEPATLSSINSGSLIHAVLENIFSEYGTLAFDDQTLYRLANDFTQKYIRTIYTPEESGAGFLVYISNLVKKIWRLLKLMRNELQNSEFIPTHFELKISADVPPAVFTFSGESVHISGAVDRVDLYKDHEKTYLRIVDYKSGKKEFDIDNIRCGIDMQMLLYLYVLCAAQKGAVPAGVMYASVNPKPVMLKKNELYKAESDAMPDRAGLFLNDEQILKKMDGTYGSEAKYLPKKPHLASEKEFKELFEHIAGLLHLMRKRLSNGDINRTAKKFKSKSGCDYCLMRDMCESAQTPCAAPDFKNLTEILKDEQEI